MNLLIGRGVFFNRAQEGDPLWMGVLGVEGMHELSAAHIQCGEQSGRSVTFVIVLCKATVREIQLAAKGIPVWVAQWPGAQGRLGCVRVSAWI